MAKQTITVELDDATIHYLAGIGDPGQVLARLADSATDGTPNAKRHQTDESLQVERDMADDRDAEQREMLEGEEGEVVRVARVVRRRHQANRLVTEREATDKNLSGERVGVDTMIVDLREANEQMVGATIRAQELTVEADAAKERAEASEHELRRVAEFREMFIGILGHDLRNPLGSIVMFAALLLRRGHLEEQDAETVTRIIRSSQRMTRMITQLLDLTRARLGGGLPIEPKPTDLREVCRNVVEEFEAPIRLVVEGDVKGTWDQDRLAEVISNLAGNAIEYAAPGTVVIVKACAEGAEVVVEVSNEGAPIPADQLPFIFEPFRRAQQHEKSAAGNLGLGLYIARQVALSHGGTLEAHSAAGTTAFVMRLPRSPPAPDSG